MNASGKNGPGAFAATPVGEVCRRAGVAKTALYWHFESKEGLLAAVIERVGTTWIEEIQKQAYLEGDPLDRLDRLIAEWRRRARQQPGLIRLLMVVQLEQAEGSARIREALKRVWEQAEAAIVEGIEDSVGRGLADLDLVAGTALTLLQGAVLRQLVTQDEGQLDRALEEMRRAVMLLILARLSEDARDALLHPGTRPDTD